MTFNKDGKLDTGIKAKLVAYGLGNDHLATRTHLGCRH
jgi:hypothetical protein